MIEKLKSYFKNLEKGQQQLLSVTNDLNNHSKEIEWANVYHDSIRGKKWLEELPLNVGRWAGNYSFFYILNRILNDYKPATILELGLGESSKFVSTYLDNYLQDTNHFVVEQDNDWVNAFNDKFSLSERSQIIHCPLETKKIKGFDVNSYGEFDQKITVKFDLYIVDGPFGSNRYSRYDIIHLVQQFSNTDEFIILFDDTDRVGETETCSDICSLLDNKGINYHVRKYQGNKASTIIATDKYKYSTSF
jgi:hypothetical protein